MKAGTLSLAMIDAVEQPDHRAAADRGEEAGDRGEKQRRPGIEGAADGQRREHRGEAHHPADREVDAGGDDDEGLAEPEQQDRRDRDEDVLRVAERQEVDRAAARHRDRDNEERDQQAEEHPRPEPAERDHEMLPRGAFAPACRRPCLSTRLVSGSATRSPPPHHGKQDPGGARSRRTRPRPDDRAVRV